MFTLRRIAYGSAVGLFLTGVWLFFFYRPTNGFGFDNRIVIQSNLMPLLHWAFAISFTVSLVGLSVRYLQDRQILPTALSTTSSIPGAIAATVGLSLGWDQLALFDVTVGRNVSGFQLFFTDEIKFVVVDGDVADPSTIAILLAFHGAMLPLAAGIAFLADKLAARASTTE